ncbi:MAG TPA: sulfatase [Devosiaceae bacterium]|jgi:arylsulfatase A-like enzyme|nr:sulfatase [Devosiaceae bacterium]
MAQMKPNILYILTDQIRASALPLYGEPNIETPNIERLAEQGCTLDNAISTAPVCTPYRSMMMTGRHPQTTGHIINFLRTRNDEIGMGDVFANAGYHTGYVGKWHLHQGSFPEIHGRDYVPEGRDRLGFDFWRAYNFHTDYFNGSIHRNDWRTEFWEGYETDALVGYTREFFSAMPEDRPFCLVVSPHQCHWTPFRFAPDSYYDRLPKDLKLPANVPPESREAALEMYRHYLAMLLTVDDMLGEVLSALEASGRADDTLVVFTSDHGTQGGSHGIRPWEKRMPYEESIKVPWIMRWPGKIPPGQRLDPLIAPVDILPSLCTMAGIPVPRTVEGKDMSAALLGGDVEQEAVLLMNFSKEHDFFANGAEWRGVRTKTHTYARWLDGRIVLFDNTSDPDQLNNLADVPAHAELQAALEAMLQGLLRTRNDGFDPCDAYVSWMDTNRRIVRNCHGELGNPEDPPDRSLLS